MHAGQMAISHLRERPASQLDDVPEAVRQRGVVCKVGGMMAVAVGGLAARRLAPQHRLEALCRAPSRLVHTHDAVRGLIEGAHVVPRPLMRPLVRPRHTRAVGAVGTIGGAGDDTRWARRHGRHLAVLAAVPVAAQALPKEARLAVAAAAALAAVERACASRLGRDCTGMRLRGRGGNGRRRRRRRRNQVRWRRR